MKTFRHHSSPLRTLVVALLMTAWLVASNHCAFGLMQRTAQTTATHATCHSCKSEPSKPQPASGGDRECCKALQGLPADTAKVEAKYDTTLFVLLDFVMTVVPSAVAAQPAVACDTGPPRALSFAERILQRSVLSHAPPCFV